MLSAEVRVSRVRPLWPVVLVGTTSAVVSALVVLWLAEMGGQPLLVTGPGGHQPVPVGAVVGSTVVAGIAALLLAAGARRGRHPRRRFLLITTVGLLLSLAPPVLAAASTATAVWLSVMHLVVAAAIVPAVAGRLR